MNNPPTEKNRRVLVVDDNRAIHDDFRKILSPAAANATLDAAEAALFGHAPDPGAQSRFEVDSAYQGQEGVLLVKNALEAGRPYALAFVDVRMPPGWDGVETTRKIWELDPSLQVVLCTAYSDYSWGEMFDQLGHRDGLLILKKPFDGVEAFQLAHALTEKWWLHQQSRRKIEELEHRVVERTAELAKTNAALQAENLERQESENALRVSEERFRSYFELGLIGMAITSPAKDWLEVNDELCRILGCERGVLLQKSWAELTHPNDLAADVAQFDRVIRREIDGYTLEKRWIRPDAKVIDTLIAARCLRREDGSVNYFVALIQDITSRKRLEGQLFQSQKMETVGKLAGGIAHEFNSILTAIIGQSEFILGDLAPNNPLRKNTIEIRKAADRAAVLTRQLLAFGRKQILTPEILDLKAVLAGMESMLLHLMGRTVGVQIRSAVGLKTVKADAGQIEQVIVNIVMNAADAMPNGGKLTLETANVTLDPEYVARIPGLLAGEYVMLAITDTGAGMSEEIKARAFEPFFSTKGVGKGTGLGLATCHGIIKQSGGHIAVYSEPGRGTSVKVYLPQVALDPAAAPAPPPAADWPRGTETILLVEDDPALREMAAILLRRLGYTLMSAADGVEALRLTHQPGRGHIDLLFTDVVMPNMSGRELADRIQVSSPKTRILFTSAYTESAIVHQGALNPGVELLQKPFTPSMLAHRVREILDQP